MTSRRKAGADVPIGDNETPAPSRDGTGGVHETSIHAGAVRLLERSDAATGSAPERADIDPTAIRHALGDTFMLAADFVDQLRFRLAGTRVCALFCREIKGEAFAALWSETSRKSIEDLLAIVTNETMGAVAGVTGAHRRRRRDRSGNPAAAARPCRPCPHSRARRAGADRAALLARGKAGGRARARHAAPYRTGGGALRHARVSRWRRPAAGCATVSWSIAAAARPRPASRPANAPLTIGQ